MNVFLDGNELVHLLALTKNKQVDEIKAYLADYPSTKKGTLFELYVRELYEGNGFMAVRKGGKNDGGADILLFDPRNPQKVVSIVQAKNHQRPLTVDDTALELYKFDTVASKKYTCPHYKLISVSGFVSDADDKETFQTMQKHLNIALQDWSYVEELIDTYNPSNNQSPYIDLHAHNKITYENILFQWKESNRVAAVQATGTGKSYLIAKCLSDFAEQKKIVFAPSNFILNQLITTFPWLTVNTTFMTYQKAAFLSEEEIEQLDVSLIVLDEFHRIGAEKWGEGVSKIVHRYANAKILGTSATPIRFLDGNRDMSDEFFENNVANQLSLADAIAQKILPMPKYVSAIYTLEQEIENFKEKIKSSENNHEEKERLLKQLNQLSMNWEKVNGIEHILKKHVVDEKKFIVFCENKSHLEEMEVFVENWFRKARLNKRIRKFRVMSGNKHNKNELNEFTNGNEKDSIYLLFSIDMLNEGMHIEDVDGVILLRKTASPIVFYQQIGRAMDANKKNNPLIFDFVNNFSSVKANDFLNDLKGSEVRFNRLRSRFGLPNVHSELDYFISDETREAHHLFSQLEKELLNTWEARYQELIVYKNEFGNCFVSRNYEPNKQLASWVNTQRQIFKKNSLSQDKIDRLNEIGFAWDAHETNWEEMFSLLQEYQTLHGDCLVPIKHKSNKQLGFWVNTQRQYFKKGLLSQEKCDRLNSISFVWNPHDAKWEEMFALLREYKTLHGDRFVSQNHESNKELATWVGKQRRDYYNGKLSKEKIIRLSEIGFVWDAHDAKWEENFSLLCDFKKLYGNCLVPRNFEANKGLATWIGTMRSYYNNGTLSQEKINRLNEIDFVWNPHDTKWEETFSLLCDYKSLHGNCLVPQNDELNKGLAIWVKTQKQTFKKGSLSQDKIDRLNEIGFAWNAYDAIWEEMFSLLQEYQTLHGDCFISGNYDSKRQLASWVNTQRRNFKKGSLSQDKVNRLNEIGFIWEIRK